MPIVSDEATRQIQKQINEEQKPLDEAASVKKIAQDVNKVRAGISPQPWPPVDDKTVASVLKTLDETYRELRKVFRGDMRMIVMGNGVKLYDK